MTNPIRPSSRPHVYVAAIAFLLGGCVSLAPFYETPSLPVPAQYGTDLPKSPSANATQDWRDHFTDPTLRQTIALALAHNRDLHIATLRVAEARAAYAIQRADGGPSLLAQGVAERSRTPAGLNPTGQPINANLFQLTAALPSWEIDFWGAVKNRNEAALQSYLATDAAQRAATLALIAQVAEGYLGLRETDERIALAMRTLDSRQETVRIFSRRVQLGAASQLQLTQVQTLLTQAQSLLAQLRLTRETQAHALDLLVGTTSVLAPEDQGLDGLLSMAVVQPGLPSELLLSRPDIVAAEHRLRATHADIGAARAAFFPRVALTGSLGFASGELDQLFKGSSRTWGFAPSVSLPLFDGGARSAALDVTKTRREIALAAYDSAVQSAFRDVVDALSARRWLAEQLEIVKAAQITQSERARLSQLRFDSGASSYLDVLDAQRDLLGAQQQVVQARRALLSSRVALYAALGGGSLTLPSAAETPPIDNKDRAVHRGRLMP